MGTVPPPAGQGSSSRLSYHSMRCSIWDSSFQQKGKLSGSNHRLQNFISQIPSLCQDFSMTTVAGRGIKVVIKPRCKLQPANAGGVSCGIPSSGCREQFTFYLGSFHFLPCSQSSCPAEGCTSTFALQVNLCMTELL